MKALVLLLVAVLFISGCTAGGNQVSFDSLDKGGQGGQEQKQNVVVTTQGEWETLWTEVVRGRSPAPALPEVDFSREMVIAVFMGTKPSGGYGIEITKIIEQGDSLQVFVRETSPGEGCAVTLAGTSPYHIAKIPATEKAITFLVEQKVTECPGGSVLGGAITGQFTGCGKDTQTCPDGSVIGRVPPNCEFLQCPLQRHCDEEVGCEEGDCYEFWDDEIPYCYQGDPCTRCPSGECDLEGAYPKKVVCR